MSMHNKDKVHATVAQLVLADDSVDDEFFRSLPGETAKTRQAAWPDRVPLQERLRARNMLVPGGHLGRGFSDEYRHIKRPLLSNAFAAGSSGLDRGNLVLVTSAVPGEGKTYTAVNLALSIAQEQDHTVLLMDCDVATKGVSRMFGVGHLSGLMDVLENDSFSVGDALLRTDVPGLSVLSAGKEHEYVTELLASQRMVHLVDEIVSRYDDRVVIFDGPPVLPTPQTHVLAGLVGQVVFVIEAGKTPHALVDEALAVIPENRAVGLVLNKAEGVARSHYHHNYYGSGAGKTE